MFGPFLRHFVPVYGRTIMRRHLDGFYVKGLERARAAAAEGPVIFAATHVCWWDGITMLTLKPELDVDLRFLIDQPSIDRLPFLEQLGALGIDRSTTASTLADLERAADFLDRPGRAVWMYPQGRYRLPHLRPLELQAGVRVLQSMSRARVIPVAMELGYFLAHLPACVMSFGEPLEPGRDVVQRLDAALVGQLDEIEAWLDEQQPGPGFEPYVRTGIVPIEERLAARIWQVLRTIVYGARDRIVALVRGVAGRTK